MRIVCQEKDLVLPSSGNVKYDIKWEPGTLPQQFVATGKLGEIKRTKKGKIWKNCWKWGACSCGLIWKMGADGSSSTQPFSASPHLNWDDEDSPYQSPFS